MSVIIWAHRGASRAERENTIAAFAAAAAIGADGVELDVRRSADGALVVHHDRVLADGRGIAALDSGQLPAHVPTLAAALDACAGMCVNLEIKNDPREPDFDPAGRIADATMAALISRGEPERWLISSFDLATVDRCRSLADAASVPIRTAWLVSAVPDRVEAMLVERGHHALHPAVTRLRRSAVERCHRAGLAVNTWTCDDPARMRELIEWGVDGICTNVPDVALRVRDESSPRRAPAALRPPGLV